MYHHDYTRELGLISPEKRVSKPVATVILAAVAAVAYLGATTLRSPQTGPAPSPVAREKPAVSDPSLPAGNLAQAHSAPVAARP